MRYLLLIYVAAYRFFHAARADLLWRLGRWPASAAAYRRALELASNGPERVFLEQRVDEVRRRSQAG